MSAPPSFIETQFQFTASIRDPEQHSGPADISARRMRTYQELIYNNIEEGVSFCYPVVKELLGEDRWHKLVREFLKNHRSQKHYYRQIPGEFLDYMLNDHKPTKNDPAFLNELLHYEWVELTLWTSEEEIPTEGIDTNGDLFTGRPVISPLAWVLSYEFPVHKIDNDFQPTDAMGEKTFLIVYRDRQDEVNFIETNAVTARLLDLIEDDSTLTGEQALKKISEEMQHPDPDVVIQGGLDTLKDLQQRDIIVGTRQ